MRILCLFHFSHVDFNICVLEKTCPILRGGKVSTTDDYFSCAFLYLQIIYALYWKKIQIKYLRKYVGIVVFLTFPTIFRLRGSSSLFKRNCREYQIRRSVTTMWLIAKYLSQELYENMFVLGNLLPTSFFYFLLFCMRITKELF